MKNLFIWVFMVVGILGRGESVSCAPRAESWHPAVVSSCVADVRTKCIEWDHVCFPSLSTDNPGQDSQVLFDECIHVQREASDWYRVNTPEQAMNSNGVWMPCLGFIHRRHVRLIDSFPEYNLIVKKSLCSVIPKVAETDSPDRKPVKIFFGSRLMGSFLADKEVWRVRLGDNVWGELKPDAVYEVTPDVKEKTDTLRGQVVANAKIFLDCPYMWGGRCAYDSGDKTRATSVDCSGLTNLIYRVLGFFIPRNSHDQYLFSIPHSQGSLLKPGDLIFLANPAKTPPRVTHVLVYIGDDQVLEAQGKFTPYITRIISAGQHARIGKSLALFTSGDKTVSNEVIYFGSLLATKEKQKEMRRLFLHPESFYTGPSVGASV
jgi:hypothetical protein